MAIIIWETLADGFPLRAMANDVRTAGDLLGPHARGLPPVPMADLCTRLWEGAATVLVERANHTQVPRYMRRWGE